MIATNVKFARKSLSKLPRNEVCGLWELARNYSLSVASGDLPYWDRKRYATRPGLPRICVSITAVSVFSLRPSRQNCLPSYLATSLRRQLLKSCFSALASQRDGIRILLLLLGHERLELYIQKTAEINKHLTILSAMYILNAKNTV